MNLPKPPRMSTGIERVFRAIPNKPGYYREILLHWLYFLNEAGETDRVKLDKQIPGGVFKEAVGDQRSLYGEIEYTFPDGTKRRLIGVREDTIY
jgi:hypothetical protein